MKSAVPVREAPPPESSVLMPFQPVNPHQQRFFRLPGRHSCDPRRTGGISPVNNSKSFCLEIGTWVRIPPSPPRRNGLRSIQKARSLTGLFSYTPSFLLFRKRSRLLRLLACKRAPNASAALPTFCEWVRGCRIPPSLIIKDP